MTEFNFPSLGKTGEVYEPPKVKVSSKLTKQQKTKRNQWKQKQIQLDNPELYKAQQEKKKEELSVGYNPGESRRNFGNMGVQKQMMKQLFMKMMGRNRAGPGGNVSNRYVNR